MASADLVPDRFPPPTHKVIRLDIELRISGEALDVGEIRDLITARPYRIDHRDVDGSLTNCLHYGLGNVDDRNSIPQIETVATGWLRAHGELLPVATRGDVESMELDIAFHDEAEEDALLQSFSRDFIRLISAYNLSLTLSAYTSD
ncbi:hypothetical protein [Bauldia litoralis]|uniref:hypothetical protein n=1 Tax=Bauldia litoralis TaxID=665467 RepID=UPI0032641C71